MYSMFKSLLVSLHTHQIRIKCAKGRLSGCNEYLQHNHAKMKKDASFHLSCQNEEEFKFSLRPKKNTRVSGNMPKKIMGRSVGKTFYF